MVQLLYGNYLNKATLKLAKTTLPCQSTFSLLTKKTLQSCICPRLITGILRYLMNKGVPLNRRWSLNVSFNGKVFVSFWSKKNIPPFCLQDLHLNRVVVKESTPNNQENTDPHHRHPKQVKVKSYDLSATDKFWGSHKGRWVGHCRVAQSLGKQFIVKSYGSYSKKYILNISCYFLQPFSNSGRIDTKGAGWIQSIWRRSQETEACHGRTLVIKYSLQISGILVSYWAQCDESLNHLRGQESECIAWNC